MAVATAIECVVKVIYLVQIARRLSYRRHWEEAIVYASDGPWKRACIWNQRCRGLDHGDVEHEGPVGSARCCTPELNHQARPAMRGKAPSYQSVVQQWQSDSLRFPACPSPLE